MRNASIPPENRSNTLPNIFQLFWFIFFEFRFIIEGRENHQTMATKKATKKAAPKKAAKKAVKKAAKKAVKKAAPKKAAKKAATKKS
jgi:hypothetical protein